MCCGANGRIQLHLFSSKPRRTRVCVLRLSSIKRRREEKMGKEMELENLKLYMENINIFEENQKLRKQASLLHQENLALMSEFRRRSNKLIK
ncbi:binding protein [Perilla frutescens var. frutescens]|nr:binding protein [Perilla frutescens var. frutescens]